MPEKFTFPTIEQAIILEKAETMEDIKISLRNWFNQTSLKISENVAWSFKIAKGEESTKRYIHCKFCQAKLTYLLQNITVQGKTTNVFKLSKFSLHHDHRLIESVRQKGKQKTFPQFYPNAPTSKHSMESLQRKKKDKRRKQRGEYYKYKKMELYYRLGLMVKPEDKDLVDVKEMTAKSLGISVERFMNFLNSPMRAAIQVSAIQKLFKKSGFEKYSIQMQSANSAKTEQAKVQHHTFSKDDESPKESNEKYRPKTKDMILEESKEYFKNIMIFVNYNEITKKNLLKSQGLINITHLPFKVLCKKFMGNIKWDCMLLYGHDENFFPNQLYAIIMIDSSRFTIKQIIKSFQITFKLLDPLRKINFHCCIHQENLHIIGALDSIIDQISQTKKTEPEKANLSLTYFSSPKLATQIISKCEFIPKIFRKKLIQKISQLDPKEIDKEFERIINELEKASKIPQFKKKSEEYLFELKSFAESFHKIFLSKIQNPSFVSLIFTNFNKTTETFDVSMEEILSKKLSQHPEGNKYFFEFLIMIFDAFKQPGGSFIFDRQEREIRESTKVEQIYTNGLMLSDHEYFDDIKKFYNSKALRGKYEKIKPEKSMVNADFFVEFSAIIYEKVYKIRDVYTKVIPQVMTVLIREIQKSFNLQIQTRTPNQVKAYGDVKVKELNKETYTVKLKDRVKLWPTEKELKMKSAKMVSLIESPFIDLERGKKGNESEQVEAQSKKVWECSCNWSKFTLLPCSHEIRCCLTFFTSIEDQVDDYWLFDPKMLYMAQEDGTNSNLQDSENQSDDKQNNSESD